MRKIFYCKIQSSNKVGVCQGIVSVFFHQVCLNDNTEKGCYNRFQKNKNKHCQNVFAIRAIENLSDYVDIIYSYSCQET
jgi:hypothetical protein